MTSVASGLSLLTTYSTISQPILVRFQNFRQIQGHDSTSKLPANSDFSQVRCFEIPLSTRDDIYGIRTMHLHHIFNHKSINFRPFPKFQADPKSQRYLETFCLLRFCQVRRFEIPFLSVRSRCEICKIVQTQVLCYSGTSSPSEDPPASCS